MEIPEVEVLEPVRYRDEFSMYGWRKVLAGLLIAAATTIPPVIAWQHPAADPPPSSGFPSGRFPVRERFVRDRGQPSTGSKILSWLAAAFRHTTVALVTTLGLMLYYPRQGFKRYALLCGPVLAIIVPACLSAYLQGREEVYRVELVLVSIIASLPAVGLYVWLTWRKGKRLGMVW
ncbi:MAG: hypothetical protein J5I93_09790 [Pirellulaceae bacterium]|nr:hypothetical protein [Pirellulaceae bacterium]